MTIVEKFNPDKFDDPKVELRNYLESCKWQVFDAGVEYQSHMLYKSLQDRYDLSSVLMRSHPDLITISPKGPVLIELKKDMGHDFLHIEAIPFLAARIEILKGQRVYYAFRDRSKKFFVFSPNTPPFSRLSEICCPDLLKSRILEDEMLEVYNRILFLEITLEKVQYNPVSSGDPYFQVPRATILTSSMMLDGFVRMESSL